MAGRESDLDYGLDKAIDQVELLPFRYQNLVDVELPLG